MSRKTRNAAARRQAFAPIFAALGDETRLALIAMLSEPESIARFLGRRGEPLDVPARSPSQGPPYWKSIVLRRRGFGYAA